MTVKTTFHKINPFTGQNLKSSQFQIVDVDSLVITKDPVQVSRAEISGKYNDLFSKLSFGECIKCKPSEAPKISHALNCYLKRTGKPGKVKTCKVYKADGLGRVWLLKG